VEVAMATLFAAVVAVHHDTGPFAVATMLATAWSAVVATAIDVEFRRIPNVLTLPLIMIVAGLLAGAAVVDGDGNRLVRAYLAAVAVPAVMLGLSLLYEWWRGQVGIGMGDVKWAVSLAMVVGWLSGLHL